MEMLRSRIPTQTCGREGRDVRERTRKKTDAARGSVGLPLYEANSSAKGLSKGVAAVGSTGPRARSFRKGAKGTSNVNPSQWSSLGRSGPAMKQKEWAPCKHPRRGAAADQHRGNS